MIKIFFFLVCSLTAFSVAQQNTFNKEYELQKFVERGGKYSETSPNIYKLTYPDGLSKIYNLNCNNKIDNENVDIETTIINVWEIDTTLYANRFSFWQKVDIVNAYEGIVFVEDLNKNDLLELYGYSDEQYPFNGPVVIFEQDLKGIFSKIYSYNNNSVFVQGIGDVNSDGSKEIHLRTNDTLNGKFYKSDSLGSLPTTFDFIFYYNPIGQINDMTFGDFDNNGLMDCAFIDWPTTYISEYDSTLNNFRALAEFSVDEYSGGFAVGDFDQDNKNEIIFSTVLQKVYVVEVVDTNHYSLVWQGLAPTYNAYMITSTSDIDENGKPEFWVGGQDFNTGISTFWCYEADGDNSYSPIAGIELRYLVSLDADHLQAADMDNNDTEELIINLENYLLILKFIGKPNQHNYGIFYAKIEELSQPGANFRPVTIADLNHDGNKDILLPMDKFVNPNTELFSYLLTQDSVTLVTDGNFNVVQIFDLIQNYPNPFNSSTQVKVFLKEYSFIKLTIYNILGKEVKILLDTQLPAGEYSIEWDGTNSDGNILNSGIYFIRMKAGSFQKTIKSILLK